MSYMMRVRGWDERAILFDDDHDDARPVRSAEQLDWPRLASYLREHAAALGMCPV